MLDKLECKAQLCIVAHSWICTLSLLVSQLRQCLTHSDVLQKKEDKQRLQGLGLLLLDKNISELQEIDYGIVDTGKGLQLATGLQPSDESVLARVLFCARPPRAEMTEKSYP